MTNEVKKQEQNNWYRVFDHMGRVTLTINGTNWMRPEERASLSVTSPTGKKLTFYKKWLSKLDGIECGFVHDLARINGEAKVTIDAMEKFKLIYDKAKN